MAISVGNRNVGLNLGMSEVVSVEDKTKTIYGEGQNSVTNFGYTGGVQTFRANRGTHKLRVWGASGGGHPSYPGGKGGYSEGKLKVNQPTDLYVYVGGAGEYYTNGATVNGGRNGGGTAASDGTGQAMHRITGTGGGGTDISLVGGDCTLTNRVYIRPTSSYNGRLIVAGGGGGSNYGDANYVGGVGGGLSGGNSIGSGGSNDGGDGGTQSAGGQRSDRCSSRGTNGSFGYGGYATTAGTGGVYEGGGGGWYGGGAGVAGGGGGSGYVVTEDSYKPSGYSVPSSCYLKEAITKDGTNQFPGPSGTTETGHSGNGYAIIESVGKRVPPSPTYITQAGAYHNPDLGLISISSDGENWITMSDKNVGATSSDPTDTASYGNTFQYGNNHGFPGDGESTAITTSGDSPDLTGYEGGNPYSNNVYRTNSRWNKTNRNLWKGIAFPDIKSLEKGPCPHGFHVPSLAEFQAAMLAAGALAGEGTNVSYDSLNKYLLMPRPNSRSNTSSLLSNMTFYMINEYGSDDPQSMSYYQTKILRITGNIGEESIAIFGMSANHGGYIRPFRDKAVVPTTGWTRLPSGQSRLPRKYQELTYIYGDGTAHINTGVVASTIKKINMEIGEMAQGSSYADQYSYVVFGTTASSWWMSSTYYTGSGSRYRYHSGDGTRKYYDCNASQTGVRSIIEYLASSFTVDGNAGSYIGTDSSWADASSSPVCFRYCGNNSRSKYRMYYSKITLNDDSELEYIPCYRKSDGLCGLYCLQNQTFYSNANSSGEFSPGEPVSFENAWEMGEHTVAYYKLTSETTVNDETSHQYTLTNQNGVTFGDFNGVDCAFFNNNSSSETGIGLYTTAFGLSTNITVSLWFYPISFPHTHLGEFQFGSGTRGAGARGTWINNNSGTRNICIGGWQSGYETITSGVPAYEGKRHHLVATKNGNDSKLYIDNKLVCTLNASFSPAQKFWIGQQECDESDMYGYISNVIVEDRTWNLAQVKGYNAQSRGQYYEGYVPTDDTVAYYPLNSKTTIKDLAYNCYHFDVNNNITFGEHQGVDCGYGNSANASSGLWETSGAQIIPNVNFTWRCWIYKISNSTDNPRLCSSYGGSPFGILMNNSGKIVCWTTSSTDGYQIPDGERHQYIITGSFTGGSYKLYVDGELVKTWSGTGYSNGVGLSVFGHDQQGSSSATSDKFNGYLSEWLLESRQWTAEEAMKDFEATKAPYGF